MSFILLFFQMALADIIVQGDAEQGEVLTVTVVDEISKPVLAETVRGRCIRVCHRIAVDAWNHRCRRNCFIYAVTWRAVCNYRW